MHLLSQDAPDLSMVSYLQVSVHDAHLVKVVDGIQHLSDERAGVLLCVEALLHDAVKQLAAGDPAHHGERVCECVTSDSFKHGTPCTLKTQSTSCWLRAKSTQFLDSFTSVAHALSDSANFQSDGYSLIYLDQYGNLQN